MEQIVRKINGIESSNTVMYVCTLHRVFFLEFSAIELAVVYLRRTENRIRFGFGWLLLSPRARASADATRTSERVDIGKIPRTISWKRAHSRWYRLRFLLSN